MHDSIDGVFPSALADGMTKAAHTRHTASLPLANGNSRGVSATLCCVVCATLTLTLISRGQMCVDVQDL